MTRISRRNWLKSVGLAGSAAMLGFPSMTRAEVEAFHPRPTLNPVKLNSNENPYGPSERVRKAITASFNDACRYPFGYINELLEMLAKKEGVTKEHIVVTGGSTEGLKVAGLIYGNNGGEIIAAQPTFLAMMNYSELWGGSTHWVPLDKSMMHDLEEMEKRISSKTSLVFLCNPNNPTSTLLPAEKVMDFCESVSEKVTVFSDEAYYDFIEEPDYPSMVELVKKEKNVIVSRTFSKVYGLAGMRIGYLVAKPSITKKIRERIVAFTNVPAIQAAKEALKDDDFYRFSLEKNKEAKRLIYQTLDDLDVPYMTSHTNFVFFKSGRDISTLQKQMLNEGVLIGRPFPPLKNWCRISTGTLEEVKIFNDALVKVLG